MIDTTEREKQAAADLQQFKELYLAGKKQNEIAALTGFSKAKCSRLKKKLGDQGASIPSQKPDNLQILQSLIREHAARFSRMTDSAPQEYKKHAGQIDDIDMGMLAMWQCTFLENDILRQLEILLKSDEKSPKLIEEIQELITGAETLLQRANKRANMQPVVPWNWSNGDSDEPNDKEDKSNEHAKFFSLSSYQAFYLKRREDLLHDLEGLKESIRAAQTMIDEIRQAESKAQRKERERARLEEDRARVAKEIYYQPIGAGVIQTKRALRAGTRGIDDLADRAALNGNCKTSTEIARYNAPAPEGKRTIIFNNGNGTEIETTIEDITLLSGDNTTTEKIFNFALIKAKQDAIYPNGLVLTSVTISYRDLAAIGAYSSPDTARKNAYKAAQKLKLFSIDGNTKKNGRVIERLLLTPENLEKSRKRSTQIFIEIEEVENGLRFILNPLIQWNRFIPSTFPLPNYYYKLLKGGSILLEQVCSLMWYHLDQIKKDGCFFVNLRTVWEWLFLPLESETGNPTVTIKNPIFEAIAAVDDAHQSTFGNNDIYLEIVEPGESYTITEFLDKGKMKVSISGDVLKMLLAKQTRVNQVVELAKTKRKKKTATTAGTTGKS